MTEKHLFLRKTARYGLRPDTPDFRDHLFQAKPVAPPATLDLREHCPPVMDQGELGSCTAHGTTGAMRFCMIKAGQPDFPMSRLQLYYDSRAIEGSIHSDAGAEIRDVIKAAATNGVAHEVLWGYDIAKFAHKPPKKAYTDAKLDLAISYERVAINATQIKQALATGFPVVVGISVYESFESDQVAKTGVVPMPTKKEQLLGGHCIYAVGYGQKNGTFTLRNSWGTGWGDKGDFYLPEDYLSNSDLASDFWLIKAVGHNTQAALEAFKQIEHEEHPTKAEQSKTHRHGKNED